MSWNVEAYEMGDGLWHCAGVLRRGPARADCIWLRPSSSSAGRRSRSAASGSRGLLLVPNFGIWCAETVGASRATAGP